MATINRNLQLRDIDGNLVFPRASADNIQISKNDGRDATLVVTVNGKIDPSLLPSSVTSVDMLLALSAAAPTGATTGDRYYNVTQNKIYTYTGSSWGSAETPDPGKIYLDKRTNNLYRYDSTSLQMMDILVHFDVTQDVADDPGDASSTNVPSEHAVSVALTKKQDNLTAVAPISIDGASSISLRYGSGLAVEGNSLTVPQSYITSTVDDLMMRDADPASPETAIVDGGTVYSILGNYEVTDTISTTVVEDTRVPTEKAVRDAINAYVATGGSSVTAGKAINVDGGSINVTASTVAEVLGSTIVTGTTVAYEVAPVVQDDLSALTPNNLRSAMSLGQAVDVSCVPTRVTFYTGTFPSDFITPFTLSGTNTGGNTYVYIGWNSFPKFAPNLKYLMVANITNNGGASVAFDVTNFSGAVMTMISSENTIATGETKRIAATFSSEKALLNFYLSSGASYNLTFANWRQYEVTALTDEAIAYLAALPDPDLFFRDTDAHNLKNRYMIKQDMVSPFIPTIDMPSDSDLTIGAGLAYKLQITGGTHYISVDTIPENGYGWDAHLQLFVKDTSSVVFKSPLNLLDPLTPNAGHNLTVKFRNGQANVYVDDIDVGYVVTVNGGTENGSLAYGLSHDISTTSTNYIVFSQQLNGSTVTLPSGSTASAGSINIVGNGPENTILDAGFVARNGNGTLTITSAKLVGSAGNFTIYAYGKYTRLDNCVIEAAGGSDYILTTCAAVSNSVFSHCTNTNNPMFANAGFSDFPALSNCIVEYCEPANNHIFFAAGTYEDTIFRNNTLHSSTACLISGYNANITIKRCIFEDSNKWYSSSSLPLAEPDGGLSIQLANTNPILTIQDCVIRTGTNISTSANASYFITVKLDGTNVIDSRIGYAYTPSAGRLRGKAFLTDGSTLDLSGNTHSIVTRYNVDVIVGYTNSQGVLEAGTASIIPYGQTEAISVTGSGNALLNTGKLGFLVTNASDTTASNTLYDALVGSGSSYSNVIFDSSLDGQAIEIPLQSTTTLTVDRTVTIIGNGIGNTVVNSAITPHQGGTSYKTIVYGIESTKPIVNQSNALSIINCYIHDTDDRYTATGSATYGCQVGGSGQAIVLSGSTFARLGGSSRTIVKDVNYTRLMKASDSNRYYYVCIQDTNKDPTVTFSNTDYWRRPTTWSATATYAVNDAVLYSGSYYLCKAVPPVGTLPTDTTYWDATVGDILGNLSGSIVLYANGSTIDNCIFDSLGWSTDYSASAWALWSFASSVTNSKFFNNRSGYDQFARDCTMSNCLFSGNNPTNSSDAAAFQVGGRTDSINTVTISGCTFATTTDNIWISGTTNTLVFADTNIVNSTVAGRGSVVFADGATVTSTIGTGTFNIPARMTMNGACTLSNIKITGTTSTVILGRPSDAISNVVLLDNVEWDSALIQASARQVYTINNCRFTGTTSNTRCLYTYDGRMNITGYYSTTGYANFYLGNTVFTGTNTFYKLIGITSTATTGTLWLIDGSVTTLSSTSTSNSGTFKVGILDSETGNPRLPESGETAVATVIINGHTLNISGTGTYIRTSGYPVTTDDETAQHITDFTLESYS